MYQKYHLRFLKQTGHEPPTRNRGSGHRKCTAKGVIPEGYRLHRNGISIVPQALSQCTATTPQPRHEGTATAPHVHRHHAARAPQLHLICTAIPPQGHGNCTSSAPQPSGTLVVNREGDWQWRDKFILDRTPMSARKQADRDGPRKRLGLQLQTLKRA